MKRRLRLPVKAATVLNLLPNDRIVVEVADTQLFAEQAEDLRLAVAENLDIDPGRVIVVMNATIKVIREGEPPPPRLTLWPGRFA